MGAVDLAALYLDKQYQDPNGIVWTVYAVASSSPIEKEYGLLALRSASISTYYICPIDLDKWTLLHPSASNTQPIVVCTPKENYFVYSIINDSRVFNDCQTELTLTFQVREFGNAGSYSSTCKYNFELVNPDPAKFIITYPTCINSNTFVVSITYIGANAFSEPVTTVKTQLTAGRTMKSGLDFTLGYGATCAGLDDPEYCLGNVVLVS